MQDPPLNPAEQVERIREILVGRQMNQVETRLERLEGTVATPTPSPAVEDTIRRLRDHQANLRREAQFLRDQLQRESRLRNEQFEHLNQQLEQALQRLQTTATEIKNQDRRADQQLGTRLEGISSAMAARIDARVREILHHLQSELSQWKNQVDREMQSLRDESVTRHELKSRIARVASAAMEDPPRTDNGFLP